MKHLFIRYVLCLFIPIGPVMAQELKTPTLEELMSGGTNYRALENLHGLQWWNDQCIRAGIDTLYTINPQSGKETMLLTRASLNKELEAAGLSKLPHLYTVKLHWQGKKQALIPLAEKYITYNFETARIINTLTLAPQAANIDYHPPSGHAAYTVNNNLYIDNTVITAEPEGILCGQSVHRNEFGINKGTFWSPCGTLLTFYRMDESMVTSYPLVDITARTGQATPIRYPMAGMTSHTVSIGIRNLALNTTLYLNTGKCTLLGTEPGIHRAQLSPSGEYLTDTYSSPDVPRGINLIATRTGKSINLLTAKDPFADCYIMFSLDNRGSSNRGTDFENATFRHLTTALMLRHPDLFIYPGHKHNVAGRDRIHLHEKITRYMTDNL